MFTCLVPGSDRIVVSCPSREERTRLVELLQRQIRSSVISPTPPATITSVSRPPYRLMTRYFSRLIKSGRLTRPQLREILDGGTAEHQRQLLLGCTFLGYEFTESKSLNRFRRQCRVDCQLLPCQSQPSSPQTRTLYMKKEFILRVPLGDCDQSSSLTVSSSSSSSSFPRTNERIDFSSRLRTPGGFGGSLERCSTFSSKSPTNPFRTQSLPALDFGILRIQREPSAEQDQSQIQHPCTMSTTVDAWVSNFSFDSGLADVGGATTSRSRDATGTSSEADISISSTAFPVYRSTLYAHWWRKAKISPTTVLAHSPPRPLPPPAGKGKNRSR